MNQRTIRAVDLFCGAGGSSTGLAQLCAERGWRLELTAINHWDVAVETHAANHPDARHLCESMENLDPRKVWPHGKRLDVLWASPECTHHSVARGGRPINDQSRASAWHVVRWAEALRPSVVLVENVPEFQTWGPIGRGGRPVGRLRGETYLAWRRALESLGYRVDAKILNAADFGEATTRRRLFVQARLAGATRWPIPTHQQVERIGFCGGATKWRAAREVIDWALPSCSIFGRPRPLSDRTLARIAEGLRRQGPAAEPFLVVLRRHADGRSLDDPMPTLCAGGQHLGLAEPFILPMNGERRGQDLRLHSVAVPLPTITTENRFAAVQPFVIPITHAGSPNRGTSIGQPLPTLTTAHRGEQALVEPFVLPPEGFYRGNAPRNVSSPLPTVTAARGAGAIVEPFLTKAYGTATVAPVSDPVPTVTTKDRFGLVEQCGLDIRFRMLQPHELAAAMGFPPEYRFSGNKGDQVKQVGNAVSVRTAKALCAEVLNG